jgi:hypothetical protein
MSFGIGRQTEEQEVMQAMMIKMTLSINKTCFQECITNFSTDKLSPQEGNCITACAKRHSGAFGAMNDISEQLQGR